MTSRRDGKTRSRRRRLRLEQLEPRLLLAADPIINEFLASNSKVIQDEDGEFSDFIELYNRGDSAANLAGWYLTDNANNLTKWALPEISLDPSEYLVIFASSKDRAVAGSELHASFNISTDGEYLALVQPDGMTIATEFWPAFPQQYRNVSYGLADVYQGDELVGQELRYLGEPTPGGPNGTGWIDFVEPVTSSQPHGFYDEAFSVTLHTPTPDAVIYYSFDGSIPGPENDAATLHDELDPIVIDRTTVFRAAAYRPEYGRSVVTTQTYIFLEDVLTQSIDTSNPENNPFGLAYPRNLQDIYGALYHMHPGVVSTWDDFNPENDDFGIREALLAIPTMSIVMDHEDLWNVESGIYPNANRRGEDWRRPGSIEYFDPNGSGSFQHNVGVQIFGGTTSRNAAITRKHSFRLIFNPDFEGPGRLNFPLFEHSDFADINTVVLKGGSQDGFPVATITDRASSYLATLMRDQWALDTHRAMGHLAPEFKYVHVYINGLYWGISYAVERTDDAMLASRLGGEPEDWDVIRPQSEYSGSNEVWNAMFALARQMPTNPSVADATYFQLQGLESRRHAKRTVARVRGHG